MRSICLATQQKVIDGYNNYSFMPDKSITRAEAAAMLVRGLKLTKQKEVNYLDIHFNHWAYPYINRQRGCTRSFQPCGTASKTIETPIHNKYYIL
ncbi:S-layer homology domain-containing protein [Paenibacillus sp. 1_12]|uniref:S-layer homology domain-containing protein n=1 Tax=Paenibacillus sp. 1_12 TaxID=1566278 RepID=UPI000B8670C5|nr:S-layer homology domain-containing protein [Paenibacillus sp. 1_12]